MPDDHLHGSDEGGFAAAAPAFSAVLGDRLLTDASSIELHSHGEAYHPPVAPEAVALPESAEEVSEILKIASRFGVAVTPFGVGTSLEGHVAPLHGGLSLDMSRMNKIRAVHPEDFDAVVEPGVTRVALNEALRDTGLMFTVDPGADASIGGMAATRASGTNTVRYGTMREAVMGLEVVLADGRIIRTGGRARKSAAGLDLTRLFVGSEGALGVITELTVRLHPIPEEIAAATCAFPSVAAAVDTVIEALQCGLPMARCELLDALQIQACNAHSDLGLPDAPHLFLEFHGSKAGVAEQVEAVRAIADSHGGADFVWAVRVEDRTKLWRARHDVYYAARRLRVGANVLATDACVPISALADVIAETQADVAQCAFIAPIVGHVGDGNFHLQLLIDPDDPAELGEAKRIAERIAHRALAAGGTITGEHGVGLGKRALMADEHGEAWTVMGEIKRALDPKGVLNPGKLFPD